MKQRMNQAVRSQTSLRSRRAFTLIELLIVIGLTAVLFTLLLVPLISAIRYTQQAQIVTAAQDAARTTRERLTRELGSALFVFDGTSHPFVTTSQTQPGDDRYTNFLNLEIPGRLANGNYTSTLAHTYACKLDFAQPRAVSDSKTPIDPTTNEPIAYRPTQNGSAIISNPAYVFPLAAGTTVTRYWIGLQDPAKPYSNGYEVKFANATNNTYVLYRAQFQPYKPKYDSNGNMIGVIPNSDLFAVGTKKDVNGNSMQIPELDDPDFFRYVKTTDVDWLDDAHATYGATTLAGQDAVSHNARVELWRSIAKPVIPGPNIDLILLPHNADNTIAYDTGSVQALPSTPCTAVVNAGNPTIVCSGVAHSGAARDPITGNYYPIVNTSVTFRPGTISGDAAPGTTSDYGSQGQPTVAGESGYGYVPTFYTATSQSWALPYHVTLFPGNYDGTQEYYDTQISSVTDNANNPPLYTAGDLLEFKHNNQADTSGILVFNVSKGYPLQDDGTGTNTYKLAGLDFVPMVVNPDTGTLNFGTPSLPGGPTDKNNRNWDYFFSATANTSPNGGVFTDGTIDLTKIDLTNSGQSAKVAPPLTNPAIAPPSAPNVRNAHIVPGGIRVTGPDTTAGPNHGLIVPYVEVNRSLAGTIGENQYTVDYSQNVMQVSQTAADYLNANPASKVTVVYDYQSNMTLTDPTKPYSYAVSRMTDNTYQPMQVKVDYQTRDLIDVSIGVRIYDITNNRAQVIPAQTKIKIGNSNRG